MLKRINKGDRLFSKALRHYDAQQWSDAVEAAQQALTNNIKHYDLAHVYAVLGFSLGKLSRYEEAIQTHKKSIEANPDHVIAWRNYGITLRMTGDYEQSECCYQRALSIKPDDEKTIASMVTLYIYTDKPQKAIEITEPFLVDGVEAGATYGNYALALAMVGRFDEADLYLSKAIALYYPVWRDIRQRIQDLREYHEVLGIHDTSWLPERCSQCGAALRDDTVHWVNFKTVQCGYCGSVNRKQ